MIKFIFKLLGPRSVDLHWQCSFCGLKTVSWHDGFVARLIEGGPPKRRCSHCCMKTVSLKNI